MQPSSSPEPATTSSTLTEDERKKILDPSFLTENLYLCLDAPNQDSVNVSNEMFRDLSIGNSPSSDFAIDDIDFADKSTIGQAENKHMTCQPVFYVIVRSESGIVRGNVSLHELHFEARKVDENVEGKFIQVDINGIKVKTISFYNIPKGPSIEKSVRIDRNNYADMYQSILDYLRVQESDLKNMRK